MFFQVVLLLGYLYADGSTRKLSLRAQGWTHAVLVLAGAIAAWIPGSAPAAGLVRFVGLRDVPYRLYALSNFGSVPALLGYPDRASNGAIRRTAAGKSRRAREG